MVEEVIMSQSGMCAFLNNIFLWIFKDVILAS